MGDITLSAGVRQNLLALQSTASLLSTTQEDLATGKKVNSALDNPSNYFTSQSLNNRANDLNALLDSIGQAQQTLNTADQFVTAGPICRTDDRAAVAGCRLLLKGGQVGPPDILRLFAGRSKPLTNPAERTTSNQERGRP